MVAARRRSHLAIATVRMRLPARGQAALSLVAALAAIAFAAILGYYGVAITLRNADVETTSLFFTQGVVYGIVPAAALGVALHAVGDALAAWRVLAGVREGAQ